MLITQSILNFPSIPRIRSAERIRRIVGNLSNLKFFLVSFSSESAESEENLSIKFLKYTGDFKCLT